MLNWFLSLFNRDLKTVLDETKTVRTNGVSFKIKKIDPISFLDGSQVMLQTYATYQKTTDGQKQSDKKVREHISQVLVAGIVEPTLSHKEDGKGFFVENLFVNPRMVNDLYDAILTYTYGKKKILSR
jgi:hypothetical protein